MNNGAQRNFLVSFFSVLRIFNRRQRAKMFFYTILQSGFSLFDLFGIILVGILTSLITRDLAGLSAGQFSSTVLNFLNLADRSFVSQILVVSSLALGFFVAKGLLLIWTNKKMFDFFGYYAAELSYKLFKLSQEISFAKLNSITSQRLTYALTGGSTSVMMGVGGTTMAMSADVALVVVILSGLFFVDFIATLVLLFSSLVFFSLLQIFLGKKTGMYSEIQAESIIKSQESIHIMKYGYKEILVAGARQNLSSIFLKTRKTIGFTSSRIKLMPIASRYALDIFFIILIIEMVVLQIVSSDLPRGIANLSIFLAALIRIVPAMQRMQQSLLTIRNNLTNLDVTFQVFDEITGGSHLADFALRLNQYDNEFASDDNLSNCEVFKQEIILQNVSLSHSKDLFILRDINLTITPKSKVLITGKSGSGKTSLLDLILGIHSPTHGKVLISGYSPRTTFDKWPEKIIYLPQEITLFRGSLRDNINFPQMNDENRDVEIVKLLNSVELGEMLSELEGGLDHELGDRGNSLSGGQKQRLGLVRALLAQPEILILDEATNALDPVMEQRLIKLVMSHLSNSIVIVVSHSELDLQSFDEVINVSNKGLQSISLQKRTR